MWDMLHYSWWKELGAHYTVNEDWDRSFFYCFVIYPWKMRRISLCYAIATALPLGINLVLLLLQCAFGIVTQAAHPYIVLYYGNTCTVSKLCWNQGASVAVTHVNNILKKARTMSASSRIKGLRILFAYNWNWWNVYNLLWWVKQETIPDCCQ